MVSIIMRQAGHRHKFLPGFSLAEVLAALTIGAMVLVAVLGIYNRAQNAAATITGKLESSRMAREILHRITEDLDGIIASGADTRITIPGAKFDNGFSMARLEILKTYTNSQNKTQTFEKIIWQTNFDYDSEAEGLVLYRSHSGIGLEDKLLDEEKDQEQRELFVPLCSGVTFFKIEVPGSGEDFLDEWKKTALPKSIIVTISFAEPFKTEDDMLDVPEEDKVSRSITIDRSRKIKFAFAVAQNQEDNDNLENKENLEGKDSEEDNDSDEEKESEEE